MKAKTCAGCGRRIWWGAEEYRGRYLHLRHLELYQEGFWHGYDKARTHYGLLGLGEFDPDYDDHEIGRKLMAQRQAPTAPEGRAE